MIEEPVSFQKITEKNTKMNIQPRQQHQCNKCDKPYFKRSTNIESENKNIEEEKLEVELVKEQE